MTRRGRAALVVAGILLVLCGALWEVGGRLGGALGEERFAFEPSSALRATGVLGGGGADLRIGFLGDVQRGVGDVARPLATVTARERLAVVVQHGDLVSHGEAPYYGLAAKAFRAGGFYPPFYVVPGNHDIEPDGVREWADGRRLFEERLGPRWWAGEVVSESRRVLLVGLDDAVEAPGEDQMAFLDRALAAHADLPWLLAIHKPPRYVDRPGHPVLPGLEPLTGRLEARPPLAVVSGHLHDDHDVTVKGVRYVVNAHGGDLDGGIFRKSRPATLLVAELPAGGDGVTFRRVEFEREPSWAVRRDQLWVRLWSERRRTPWAPWALVGAGLVLGILALRRRARAAAG